MKWLERLIQSVVLLAPFGGILVARILVPEGPKSETDWDRFMLSFGAIWIVGAAVGTSYVALYNGRSHLYREAFSILTAIIYLGVALLILTGYGFRHG